MWEHRINCGFEAPEIVFVGKKGSGKSTLIECILGHTMLDPGATLRPVEIRMVNNPACETPRVTVLRDTALAADFPADEVDVPLVSVPERLKARNVVRTAVPVRVLYEARYCWDMTLYDTPGLLRATGADAADAAAVEATVLALARPAQRLVVSVEEVGAWDLVESVDFAARVDPRRERTLFVFNKLAGFVAGMSSAAELAAFLRGGPQLPLLLARGARVTDRVFFTTLPTGLGRSDKAPVFRRKIAALHAAQLQSLEALQYDTRFAPNIGAGAVQRRVLQWVWNRYQSVVVPAVIRHLRGLRAAAAGSRAALEARAAALTPQELRRAASLHASAWLDPLAAMLCGALVARPALHGETLAAECAADDAFAAWTDARLEPIALARSDVPGAADRLYGAAQFERLLREFRAVVAAGVRLDPTPDEVAAALGATRPDCPAPDVAAAACRLVHHGAALLLPPLVAQLVARARAIFVRLVDIADRLPGHGWTSPDSLRFAGDGAASGPTAGASAGADGYGCAGGDVDDDCGGDDSGNDCGDAEDYPLFTTEVKSMYCELVDTLCAECVARCALEVHDAAVLGFELRTAHADLLESTRSSSPAKHTLRLANALFDRVKTAFVQNVALTCHDVLLVTLQTRLAHVVLTRIAQLDDAQLDELFEAPILKQRLARGIVEFDGILNEGVRNDKALMDAAAVFAQAVTTP